MHYQQRRLVLKYAQAGFRSEYGCDIDCQVDIDGSEAVCSFFHGSSMAVPTTDAAVRPKLGKVHFHPDTLYG